MSERLEIDALRALLAIMTHGGVTRAADHLALSQSAVSHKVRRLEQTLDCQLLSRRAGAPLFTETGERLLDYARRMVTLHDEALASLGKKSLAGTINLGMTEDTTIAGFANVLGRFTRLYPEVRVRTRTAQSLNVQAWLKAGELDVALMQIFCKDMHATDMPLFEDKLFWVKSPDLALDLSQSVPFLSFDPQCFYRQWAFVDGQSKDHQFEVVLECPSAAGIQSAVRSGLGISLLNELHITPDMEVIEGIFPTPPEIVYIARTHLKTRNPAVQALISELAAEMNSAVPLRAAG